jgi:hypothetical protein
MAPTEALDALDRDLTSTLQQSGPWTDFVRLSRRPTLRLKADVFELRKRRCEFSLTREALELKTPGNRYRFSLKGLCPLSEFTGQILTVTFHPLEDASASPQGSSELDRATWRAANAARGGKHVFVTRALNAVADIAERNPEQSLAAPATAPSDWEVLLRALATPELVDLSTSSSPLAQARLRGIEARQQLLEAEGGTFSAEEAGRALGVQRQAVDKRRQAGTLLGLSTGAHGYRYPSWQFTRDGVLGGVEPALRALARHDDWMKLAFFVTGNDRLAGRSPVQRLRDGKVSEVLDAAQVYGQHGAA